MVFRCGRMVRDMKASGKITKLMAKALFGMFMGTSMLVTGWMTRHKDSGYILIQMEQATLANGRMTFSMDMELKNGLMDLITKVTTYKAESKVKGPICGLMDHSTMEIGLRTKSMEKVNTSGSTVELTQVIGSRTIWMDMVFIHG